jgi:peroxiredoxin
LYDELKDKGLELIAVDANDTVEAVNKFMEDNKYTFKVVMGGRGEQYTLGKAYGVPGYPTNFLVDADGKIIYVGVGFSEERFKELREAVEKALK